MRPKYSSPGAEPLNCSHCRCAHLLLVSSHGSFFGFVDAFGAVVDAFGAVVDAAAGVAARADAERSGAMYNRPVLATAIVSDSVGRMRLTCEKISLRNTATRGKVHWGTSVSSHAGCRPPTPMPTRGAAFAAANSGKQ
jgi:hypothetical protein